MHRIIVAGNGPDVGKTIVAAILTTLMDGDYWKPVQCGDEESSDTSILKKWVDPTQHRIFSPTYSFKAPLSPHHAARLENICIKPETIVPPETSRPLIIESVGGILVPLTTKDLTLDLFKLWNCHWIIVSRHYLGSINQTLLTIAALKQHKVCIAGIIFNGEPNPDTESIILEISQLPFLGRVLPEINLNRKTIQRYAEQWKPHLFQLLP